jgi:transposase-like protein
MNQETGGVKAAIRYSEAFKMQLVRELEKGEINYTQCRRKYGIRGVSTLQKWVGKYGNGSLGKVIRVEEREAIDEREQLRRRVRALEKALADANIDLALERQYTRLACKRAGINDVAEFKKKADGQPPMGP